MSCPEREAAWTINRPTSPLLVDDLIAIHRNYPSLHRTLLDLPNPEEMKAVYDVFQKEYLRRYALVIADYRGSGPEKRDTMTAQVLSSALEGVIHNAARRGCWHVHG